VELHPLLHLTDDGHLEVVVGKLGEDPGFKIHARTLVEDFLVDVLDEVKHSSFFNDLLMPSDIKGLRVVAPVPLHLDMPAFRQDLIELTQTFSQDLKLPGTEIWTPPEHACMRAWVYPLLRLRNGRYVVVVDIKSNDVMLVTFTTPSRVYDKISHYNARHSTYSVSVLVNNILDHLGELDRSKVSVQLMGLRVDGLMKELQSSGLEVSDGFPCAWVLGALSYCRTGPGYGMPVAMLSHNVYCRDVQVGKVNVSLRARVYSSVRVKPDDTLTLESDRYMCRPVVVSPPSGGWQEQDADDGMVFLGIIPLDDEHLQESYEVFPMTREQVEAGQKRW
jgi:hypothetical protein